MSLTPPAVPPLYDAANETAFRAGAAKADALNRKSNEDVVVGRNRLILTDTATGKRYSLTVVNGLVVPVAAS